MPAGRSGRTPWPGPAALRDEPTTAFGPTPAAAEDAPTGRENKKIHHRFYPTRRRPWPG